jgi:hypothetical protein
MSAIGQDDHGAPVNDGQGASEGNPFDFERAYGQLHPEYTRSRQELSTYRERLSEYEQLFEAARGSDPDLREQALAALGVEMDTGSHGRQADDDEFVDPLEEQLNTALERLGKLESERELEASEKESLELDEMRDEYIGEAITFIEDNLKSQPQYGDNFKFSEREEEVLGNLAIAMTDAEGVPDVQGAYNALYGTEGLLEVNRTRWYATKTSAAQPPSGTTVPADQKPKTPRERARAMDARLAAIEDQR